MGGLTSPHPPLPCPALPLVMHVAPQRLLKLLSDALIEMGQVEVGRLSEAGKEVASG